MLDAIIIGGGVIGCAVARELSRYRLSVALLEKTADICNGQSKANTAIVHGGYDATPGTQKAKFNVLGNRMFPATCAELDVPYVNNTSLVISFRPEDRPSLEKLMRQGQENGVSDLSIIDREELRRREPNVGKSACDALVVGTGGITCPYELTIAFAENAAMNGVQFFRGTAVTGLSPIKNGWQVVTPKGIFESRTVVNCAGLYSDAINNMVSRERFTIMPRRGEYYLIDKKYKDAFHAAMFQLPTEMGKGILIAATVDGTVLIGPTAEDIERKDDTRTTAGGLAKALYYGGLTWENIPTGSFITTFSGLRAHADRGDFILGEALDAPGFFNAGGIESPGLTSSPAIGRYLASMVAEHLRARPKKSFDPIRRGIPKFRLMTPEERRAAIAGNPDYAHVVCRCETVTEAEIREAIRRPVGARTVDGIKRRTRAGMGRCQAGFCTPRTLAILCEELGISPLGITKDGGKSYFIDRFLFDEGRGER